MANIGLALGGLAEGYQRQQEQQQRQLYQQFLIQQAQQQAAQQAQALTQQQQALGTAWGASGQLGGGGMGGQPRPPQQQPMPQQQAPLQTAQMPQAPSGMSWGGAAAAAPLVRQAESGGNYNVGYGGADLSNAPKDATGFPQWAGKQGPAGISHAAGAYQFQPAEWKKYAGGLGVTDFSQGSQDKVFNAAYGAEGPKPWASNPKVMQALQPIISEAKQTSQQVTQAVPQQQWGRSSVEDLHRAVEQANPDASPQVKMLALLQLQKLMAPQEKMELQAWAMQNRAELQVAMKEFSTQQSEKLAEFKQGLKPAEGEKGWQILQTPQGAMRVNPNTGQTAQLDLPAGTTKMGTTAQGGAAPQPDPQKDTMAQGIANYQIAPLSGWALRTPWGKQTMENVLALNPKYAAPDYAARISGTRAFTSGKQSDTIRSMDVAISHLDTVDQLSQALANGDAVQLNKLGNLLKTQTGAEGVVDFNFAKTIVTDEIVKATAGGVLTGQERGALAQQMDAANSPEQLSGVISTAKALMAGQLGGLRRQFEGATGKGDEAFDKKLAPETRDALAGKAGGTGGGYTVGQVIDKGGKKYRVTGGDPNDPDVEEVK